MVSTCLIGSDPGVSVRHIWTRSTFSNEYLAALQEWGNLHEVELRPGDTVFKLSRHLFEGDVYTWAAVYRQVHPWGASKRSGVIGAGIVLHGTQGVNGPAAIAYLDEVLEIFARNYAPEDRLLGKVNGIVVSGLPIPPRWEDVDAEMIALPPESGLHARRGKDPGEVMFIDAQDFALEGEQDLRVKYLHLAQQEPFFASYHTLLIGRGLEAEQYALASLVIVTPEELQELAERAAVEPDPDPAEPHDRPERRTRTGGFGLRRPDWQDVDPRETRRRRRDSDASRSNESLWFGVVLGIAGTIGLVLILGILGMVEIRFGRMNAAETHAPVEANSSDDREKDDAGNKRIAGQLVNTYVGLLGRNETTKALKLWDQERVDGVTNMTLSKALRRYESYRLETRTPNVIEADPNIRVSVPVIVEAKMNGSVLRGEGTVTVRKADPGSDPPWVIETFEPGDDQLDPVKLARP